MKPRIRWLPMVRCWACRSNGPTGYGITPGDAYDEWRRLMFQCRLLPQGVKA